MNFWNFGAIFVDFSEARDLFVNIFRISDRTGKIEDRGLILENPRGLSAKSAKSGPWVDFTKVQGPFARFPKYPGITNYFLTDNSWTGSTSPWTGRARSVHRGPTPAQTTGTAACSPELGLRPFRCVEARWRGCNRERSEWGTRLGPHQGLSGVEVDG
jgi:hypothetical protein